ncbi:hypothetical protein FOMPIDRAFT_1136370 [Fomitopsis schrenkii]|uniref:Uncharacterized protein n=1 Tax=Fomitopsis schrenkii TaxID=2126942 RepID=S8EUJ3_FOMSC|nr:hypothetical protein FOMPIDRAFT_1136370 [Fomitopsis schrenkii]
MAVSSIFALLLQPHEGTLCDEATIDYDKFLKETGLPRMDGQGAMASDLDGQGEYHIKKDGKTVVYHHQELAPPAGVVGANYSQCSISTESSCPTVLTFHISIHSEKQPHKYAYLWTTGRTVQHGGNFYVAEYGIKVLQAPDTFIAWQPAHAHGTSLIGYQPPSGDLPLAQQGLGFVTSMHLALTWKKFVANKITEEQAAEEFAEDLKDEIDDREGIGACWQRPSLQQARQSMCLLNRARTAKGKL